jgi:hypothetical protein
MWFVVCGPFAVSWGGRTDVEDYVWYYLIQVSGAVKQYDSAAASGNTGE